MVFCAPTHYAELTDIGHTLRTQSSHEILSVLRTLLDSYGLMALMLVQ
jgi:hypothetical protein